MSQIQTILSAHNIRKSYHVGANLIKVFSNLSIDIHVGEFVAIMGLSGSGKSTLLGILSSLESPDGGEIKFKQQNILNLDDTQKARLRNQQFGFMFQSYSLIPGLTALDNVGLPLLYAGQSTSSRNKKSEIALEIVGLKNRLAHTPAELSGGQQQRVALARALINNPDILFADEPTGSLDQESAMSVMDLFCGLKQAGRTIVMVTHDADVAAFADTVYLLDSGMLKQAK